MLRCAQLSCLNHVSNFPNLQFSGRYLAENTAHVLAPGGMPNKPDSNSVHRGCRSSDMLCKYVYPEFLYAVDTSADHANHGLVMAISYGQVG